MILEGCTAGRVAGMPDEACPEAETVDTRPLAAAAFKVDTVLGVAHPWVEVIEVEDFRAGASVELTVEDSEGAPGVSSKSEMKTKHGIAGGRA